MVAIIIATILKNVTFWNTIYLQQIVRWYNVGRFIRNEKSQKQTSHPCSYPCMSYNSLRQQSISIQSIAVDCRSDVCTYWHCKKKLQWTAALTDHYFLFLIRNTRIGLNKEYSWNQVLHFEIKQVWTFFCPANVTTGMLWI